MRNAHRAGRAKPAPVYAAALCCMLMAAAAPAARGAGPDEQALFRDTYKQLIEINTTDSAGSTTVAAQAMRERLRTAGFPDADMELIEPFPRKGNLVVRYRGTGEKRPILLLAHIDVVEANRADWQTDPFVLQEKDGALTARGAIDDKAMAAIFVSVLSQLRREGFTPNRDIILALTADEERGASPANGAQWLLDHRRDLVDAEYGINEGGRGELRAGKPFVHTVQIAEKLFSQVQLEATGPGGHSARPTPDNTIYDLAEALVRLRRYDFPVRLNDASRTYFARSAPLQVGSRADDYRAVSRPEPDEAAVARLSAESNIVGLLRTTCVATMAQAGHAPNALAQSARATVNCRILPDDDPQVVFATLAELAGPKVKATLVRADPRAPGSPLRPDLLVAVERLTEEMWPGTQVIPTMGVSTTDSRRFRAAGIPMYGVSGLFVDPRNTGVHGLNEHIGVQQLLDGRAFLYRLVRDLSR